MTQLARVATTLPSQGRLGKWKRDVEGDRRKMRGLRLGVKAESNGRRNESREQRGREEER